MAEKYTAADKKLAKELLRAAALPRDALPYTQTFDQMQAGFEKARKEPIEKGLFWKLLCRVGKEGGVRGKKRAAPAPAVTQDEALEILRLCPEGIGRRDSLPYTDAFDQLYERFIQTTGRNMTKNAFWRVVSGLAKRSRKPKPIDLVVTETGLPQALEHQLVAMNPWWQGEHGKPVPPAKRSIYATIVHHLKAGAIPGIAVRGPRQVGKTTLQQQIIRDFLQSRTAKQEHILRVQFDELPSLGALGEPVPAILRWYERRVLRMSVNQSARRGHPVYLFLDEVQNLQAWDGQVKALLDHHQCRAFLTGSSALRMQAAKDNLAGRITTIDLGPLHLAEIATLRNYGPLEPYQKQLDLTSWTNKGFWIGLSTYEGGIPLVLDRAFRDFSEWGAYPFCHATPDINWQRLSSYLTDVVVERTIEHDSATASEKGQKVILAEVFRQAMRYAGQAPKCSTLASELTDLLEEDVKPADVRGNLEFLQRCMLIRLIEPLQLRLKRQTAPCKICICDHSVRSAWLQEKVCFVSDASDAPAGVDQDIAGHVLESVLGYYLSTFEGISLRHFPQRPSEPEVDYIVPVGSMRIPIEVKYRTNAVTPANLAGLQAFTRKNAYNAPFGILVTRDEAGDQGNNIIAIPARNFLLLG